MSFPLLPPVVLGSIKLSVHINLFFSLRLSLGLLPPLTFPSHSGGVNVTEQLVNVTTNSTSGYAMWNWNLTNGPIEAMNVSVSNYSTVFKVYDPNFESTGSIGNTTFVQIYVNFCASEQAGGMALVGALTQAELGAFLRTSFRRMIWMKVGIQDSKLTSSLPSRAPPSTGAVQQLAAGGGNSTTGAGGESSSSSMMPSSTAESSSAASSTAESSSAASSTAESSGAAASATSGAQSATSAAASGAESVTSAVASAVSGATSAAASAATSSA